MNLSGIQVSCFYDSLSIIGQAESDLNTMSDELFAPVGL